MFGIVNDEDFEAQLNNLEKKKESHPAKIVDIQRGRGEGKKEIPPELRNIISENAIQGVPAKELSQLFNVSPSSISAYKNDATSTASYHQPDESLSKSNDAVREKILTGARGKLLMAMDAITEEKVNDAKVRDVASIAKDMSAIVRNMEPEHGNNGSRLNQQFIFMTPKTKSEEDFEVIELNN